MSQPFRIRQGSDIDPLQPLSFAFNGRRYRGYAGDSLASALLANGVRVFGRSFKRHRPRGLFAAGVEETGALVQLGEGIRTEPIARASLAPLREGLRARTLNHWPSLNWDLLRALDLCADLFPAGFYNKTFIWPSWHFYEPLIRRLAGFGRAPPGPDPDQYAHRHLSVDVLICGGGPVGLAAALAEAEAGQSVLIAEQDARFGGSLLREPALIAGQPSDAWLAEQLQAVQRHPRIEACASTQVAGLHDHNSASLVERHPAFPLRERWLRVRAKRITVATGTIEQPLVFENNDRPGIMLLGAMQTYLRRFGVKAGERIALAGNHDGLYRAALDFAELGVPVAALIDSRAEPNEDLAEQVRALGTAVHPNAMILDARGGKALRGVRVDCLDKGGLKGEPFAIACDALGVSGGPAPAVHLLCHAKAKLRYDERLAAFAPGELPPGLAALGAAAGNFDLENALADIARPEAADGEARAAQRAPAQGSSDGPTSAAAGASGRGLCGPRRTPGGASKRQWVDLLHDVTLADLDLAVAENFRSVEHLKRYTTVGMALDQGKTSNLNAIARLAETTGRPVAEVGVTTYRPPFAPVSLGVIAGGRQGRFYQPIRESPLHAAQARLGAHFEHYGAWLRPACYPRAGESEFQAICREAGMVREGLGLFDNSPLGKLEVRGPDAAEFLDRVYLNNARSLQAGRGRYGLMLNENGVIIDDGLFFRLADAHFLVSTTSGNAARIHQWLEEWLQCEWTDLDVTVQNATSAWANVTLAGPQSRALLASFNTDIDLSDAAFPHQSIRAGVLEGLPARIMRASFSGELGFELNLPANHGAAFWDEALARGERFGAAPYGVEAAMSLRIEKGYLHIGTDTDGTTTPDDAGWGHLAAAKQTHFIGKRSLARSANRRPDRLQFVGIRPLDEQLPLHAGGHLTAPGESCSQGYVTSACYSPSLGRWIALGLLRRGRERHGETLDIFDGSERRRGWVAAPAALDPEGKRLHG